MGDRPKESRPENASSQSSRASILNRIFATKALPPAKPCAPPDKKNSTALMLPVFESGPSSRL